MPKTGFIIAPFLKERDRAEEKVASDYGGDWSRLLDVVRATVAVDSLEELEEAVKKVSKSGKVVRVKNRFSSPLSNGYRDYLMNLQLPSGVIAEVQFHLKPILKAREQEKEIYETVREIEAALKEEGRDSMTEEEIAKVQEAHDESSHLFEQAWQDSQKPKKDKRLHKKTLTPPTVDLSPLFTHWVKYYVKESGFTGERFDVTGRRYCYAGGRKVPCRPKGSPQEKVTYKPPKQSPNKFQTTPDSPTTGRGKKPDVEEENSRATMLLYAVIFNKDGQILVKEDDPWGGFVWSGKRNGFIEGLQAAIGHSLKDVGMVGNASEGQGYYVLQAEGELKPEGEANA